MLELDHIREDIRDRPTLSKIRAAFDSVVKKLPQLTLKEDSSEPHDELMNFVTSQNVHNLSKEKSEPISTSNRSVGSSKADKKVTKGSQGYLRSTISSQKGSGKKD